MKKVNFFFCFLCIFNYFFESYIMIYYLLFYFNLLLLKNNNIYIFIDKKFKKNKKCKIYIFKNINLINTYLIFINKRMSNYTFFL